MGSPTWPVYILRRILISIPVLILITFSIYVLIDLAPGDPTDFFINPELGVTEENLANLRRFGLISRCRCATSTGWARRCRATWATASKTATWWARVQRSGCKTR